MYIVHEREYGEQSVSVLFEQLLLNEFEKKFGSRDAKIVYGDEE